MQLQSLSNNTSSTTTTNTVTLTNLPGKEERFKRRLNFCIELLQMVEDSHQFNTPLSLPLLTSEQRKELIDKPEKILSIITNNWNQAEKFDSVVDITQKISLILFKHGHKKHLTSRYSYKRIAAQCFKQFTHCFNSKLPSEQLYEMLKQFITSPSSLPAKSHSEFRSHASRQTENCLPLSNESDHSSMLNKQTPEIENHSKDKDRAQNSLLDDIDEEENILVIDDGSDADCQEESPLKRRKINEIRTSDASVNIFESRGTSANAHLLTGKQTLDNINSSQSTSSVQAISSTSKSTQSTSKDVTSALSLLKHGVNTVPLDFSYPFKDIDDYIKMLNLKILLLQKINKILADNPTFLCSIKDQDTNLIIEITTKANNAKVKRHRIVARTIISLFTNFESPPLNKHQQAIINKLSLNINSIKPKIKNISNINYDEIREFYTRALNDLKKTISNHK